jgi:uncharacterized protein (UPF0332 family)
MAYQPLERAGLIEHCRVAKAEIKDLLGLAQRNMKRIRRKRHQAVYWLAGAISEREAKRTIEFAQEFLRKVADLI